MTLKDDCETMVVLCKFLLEALHTWTYTTNWQCYPPMGPRLYTPLSFSLDPTGLTPTTLFGLTADPRQCDCGSFRPTVVGATPSLYTRQAI